MLCLFTKIFLEILTKILLKYRFILLENFIQMIIYQLINFIFKNRFLLKIFYSTILVEPNCEATVTDCGDICIAIKQIKGEISYQQFKKKPISVLQFQRISKNV